MKQLIIKALHEAFVLLNKKIPTHKTKKHVFDLDDTSPADLPKFMSDNGIPAKDAYFAGIENGYDAYRGWAVCYDEKIALTEIDKKDFSRKSFPEIAHSLVWKVYRDNGYKVEASRSKNDYTIYNIYLSGDFSGIETYYNQFFKK